MDLIDEGLIDDINRLQFRLNEINEAVTDIIGNFETISQCELWKQLHAIKTLTEEDY